MSNLISYLPNYYKNSAVMIQLMGANEIELQTIDDKLTNVLDQYLIGSADTAIARWEKEFNIPIDESKPLDQRRSILLAKLRGAGTTTAQLIKSTALAYTNGEVEIEDNATTNTVVIRFISIVGLPANIDDLKTSIDDIVPAHLLIEWEYKYNTHADLSQYTHAHLSLFTYEQLRSSDVSTITYGMLEGQSVSVLEGVS